MFQVTILQPEGAPRVESISETSAVIGKGRECRLQLPGWKVGREHARIYRTKSGLFIQDLGQFFGTSVNGVRVHQHGPLAADDRIVVGPFTLIVADQLQPTPAGAPAAHAADTTQVNAPQPMAAAAGPGTRTAATPEQYWRRRIHEALLDAIDLRRRDLVRMSDDELRAEAESLLVELIDKETALPDGIDRDSLRRDVLNEAVGLGPLDKLLADEAIAMLREALFPLIRERALAWRIEFVEAEEIDASWLGGGRAVIFARGHADGSARLWVSQCRQGTWGEASPLSLSFNDGDGHARGGDSGAAAAVRYG